MFWVFGGFCSIIGGIIGPRDMGGLKRCIGLCCGGIESPKEFCLKLVCLVGGIRFGGEKALGRGVCVSIKWGIIGELMLFRNGWGLGTWGLKSVLNESGELTNSWNMDVSR